MAFLWCSEYKQTLNGLFLDFVVCGTPNKGGEEGLDAPTNKIWLPQHLLVVAAMPPESSPPMQQLIGGETISPHSTCSRTRVHVKMAKDSVGLQDVYRGRDDNAPFVWGAKCMAFTINGFVGKGSHGMQSLGKVAATSRRMPNPASLPSLRSENAGNDPTVALVPSGGGGWKKDKDGKELREDGDEPPPPPPPPPSSSQRPDVPPVRDDKTQGESARVVHPPPPLKQPPPRQQAARHPPRHPPRQPPSPGKKFKADFPSLEEQETMSRKEIDELHRRKAGSPEPPSGKRTGTHISLYFGPSLDYGSTGVKGAWEQEAPHNPSQESQGSYGRYNYTPTSHPPHSGPYPLPNPYMMQQHPSGSGEWPAQVLSMHLLLLLSRCPSFSHWPSTSKRTGPLPPSCQLSSSFPLPCGPL